jgi:hypothetical protein
VSEKEKRPEYEKRHHRKNDESSGLGEDEYRPPWVEMRIGWISELPDDGAIELAGDGLSVSHEIARRTEEHDGEDNQPAPDAALKNRFVGHGHTDSNNISINCSPGGVFVCTDGRRGESQYESAFPEKDKRNSLPPS